MPRLGLSNRSTKGKDRVPNIIIDEDFASGTGGFTFTATTGSNDTERLKTIASGASTPHYAYKILPAAPGVTYNYSIELETTGLGGGHIQIGSGVGNSEYVNQDAASATIYTGSFTIPTSVTLIVLHLVGDNDSVTTKWDNILIQEDN